MNRSESKYFNTALKMDEALISLLENKDLEYITIKEICEKAGVNRSTFYLHYETVADLVNETAETVNKRFTAYFPQVKKDIFEKLGEQELSNLVLITEEYLLPYLRFIKDNQKIYRAAFRNPAGMQSHMRYGNLKKYILIPILECFGVPPEYREYYISYYIEGIAAVIRVWLGRNCEDSTEMVAAVIEECVRPKGHTYDREK